MNTLTDEKVQLENYSRRLKAARKASGFKSARAFAKAFNIAESTYSQHETGSRRLSIEILLRYSSFLKVNANWVLTGEGPPYSPLNKDKENTLYQEIQSLSDYKDLAIPQGQFPLIGGKVSVVNMELFFDILNRMLNVFDEGMQLSYDELLDFCVDIYNNVVNIPDTLNKNNVIELSISSLIRGIK